MIAPLALEHVDQVARLHCAELTGLLSEFGEDAARAYYSGCLRAGAIVGFVDLEGGRLRGFVVGAVHPESVKRSALRSNPAGIAAALAAGGLRRPAALAWLLKSFRGPDEGRYDPGQPELTYLAVSPESRRSGIGERLVDAFSRALRGAGAPAYELSVDDGNEKAAAFYERRGFKSIGTYREFGVLHRRLRLQLSETKPV